MLKYSRYMRAVKKFSTSISQVNNSTRKKGVSLSRLFKLLDKRSNYILTFVAFFLIIIPLPVLPGFSIILAIPSIFITLQICFFNERVFIPKCISSCRISKNIIRKIDNSSRRYLTFMEKLTKKRLLFFVSPKLQQVYNIILFLFAISSAVPIPFLCMIPAFGGVLMSAGLIVKDGILTVLSLIIGFTGMTLIYLTIKTLVLVKNYLPL